MSQQTVIGPVLSAHGSARLPSVEVESYNLAIKDGNGFVGDRASKGALRDFIEEWRKPLRQIGRDPFAGKDKEAVSKKQLDELLAAGEREAAGVVQGAIEDFAHELASVTQRFLKLKGWKEAERLVIGGGLTGSRVGELAIGRASVLLKADKIKIDVTTVRNDPDEAGLIGAGHLAPAWMFHGHDAILAVDIGGTNMRAGVVELNLKRDADLSKAKVWKFELWRHGDEKLNREDAVQGLIEMLERLIKRADKEGLRLAPFIGIGCPGSIEPDGTIARGAEPARQLGEQPLQSPAIARRSHSENRRFRHHDPDAQRRRGAGLERAAADAGRRMLGRVHHRHRTGQRAVSESECGERLKRINRLGAVDRNGQPCFRTNKPVKDKPLRGAP